MWGRAVAKGEPALWKDLATVGLLGGVPLVLIGLCAGGMWKIATMDLPDVEAGQGEVLGFAAFFVFIVLWSDLSGIRSELKGIREALEKRP